ncbi:MAG: hypothetical protein WDA18_07880 [Candidatus Ratteibacteria bacterium]|jgi:tetratricopeptide (TPR) repeat protein
MKKTFLILTVSLAFFIFSGNASSWFQKNRNLSVIYSPEVWTCIEKADKYEDAGRDDLADNFLKKAEQLTLKSEPFDPKNWPSHWPQTQNALNVLKYASPSAYIYKILGDYALSHKRPKEATAFFQTYLRKSLIPDAACLQLLAETYQRDELYPQAIATYQSLATALETKNFHGVSSSLSLIYQRIRTLQTRMKPSTVLLLDMQIQQGVPEFLADINLVYKEYLRNGLSSRSYQIVPEQILDNTLKEQGFTRNSLISDLEDRVRVVKLLNVDYVIEPVLMKAEKNYLLLYKVYRGTQIRPDESYEYQNENYEFLPNYLKRFALQFEGKGIPEDLLIPENQYKWGFETAEKVTALAISDIGSRLIVGCAGGQVLLFSQKGRVEKTFRAAEEIMRVAISPDAEVCAWSALHGALTLATSKGSILVRKKTGNLVRAISLGNQAKFWAYAYNNAVVYLDRKGEVFWEKNFPEWIGALTISSDASLVAVGCTNGAVSVLNAEGNLLWQKKLSSSIERITIAPNASYIAFGTQNGQVTVFDRLGNETATFTAGEETEMFTYYPEILGTMAGIWNNWFYALNTKTKLLWHFTMDPAFTLMDSDRKSSLLATSRGKNLFFFDIVWK